MSGEKRMSSVSWLRAGGSPWRGGDAEKLYEEGQTSER